MEFRAAGSRLTGADDAVDNILLSLAETPIRPAEVGFLFVTSHHRLAFAHMADRLRRELELEHIIGCTCEGVVAGSDEIERRPGIALLVGHIPNARFTPFCIAGSDFTEALTRQEVLETLVGVDADRRAIVLLADPFTTPAEELLAALNALSPYAPTVGGMASGAQRAGDNALLLNEELFTHGAVGLAISGELAVTTVVSQGCSPVGQPFLVTSAAGNMLHSLDGRPALECAQETMSALSPDELRGAENGLMLGVAVEEYRHKHRRGDFVVRALLGIERDTGALAVSADVRIGQTVQFHVHDAETASEDLAFCLDSADPASARGALMFTCNGRGTRLFAAPDHDARALQAALPGLPAAGFFAMGELGPVGNCSFMHGHTASIAIFGPALSQPESERKE